MTNKPGNHVSTEDMMPSPTDEIPAAPGAKPVEAPETERVEDDGEPLGSSFA